MFPLADQRGYEASWVRSKGDEGMRTESTPLRMARLSLGWSQTRLIAAMRQAARPLKVQLPGDECLETNIRRWERGTVTPGVAYRRVLRAVYGMTDAELGLPPLDEDTLVVLAHRPTSLSGETLSYYGTLLTEHLRADNLMGPRYVLEIAEQQMKILTAAAREARGTTRIPIIEMACRYHEFSGWLHQDTGRCEQAMTCTNRALDLAAELDAPHLVAYLRMRKSNIATDMGDTGLAIRYANAALSVEDSLPPRLKAVVLRQQANSHVALGNTHECEAAISEALELAAEDDPEGHELAGYCTTDTWRWKPAPAGCSWVNPNEPSRRSARLMTVGRRSCAGTDPWPSPGWRPRKLPLATSTRPAGPAWRPYSSCVPAPPDALSESYGECVPG